MTMVQIFDSSQDGQLPSSDQSSKSGIIKYDRCNRPMTVICTVAAGTFFLSTVFLAILLGMKYNEEKQQREIIILENVTVDEPSSVNWPKPSGSLHGRFKRAAIATDHGICSGIGRDILIIGGNAVDATIAALICIGVVNPQSSGLGGGLIMTIYNSTNQRCVVVDARETASASANETMFVANPDDAVTGYRSIATPSELHGLWTVYTKYGSGKISWSRLLKPSVDLALQGFPVSADLASYIAERETQILAEPILKRTFINPETEHTYEEGDVIKREHLGLTLQLLANSSDPVQLFYNGGIAQTIAAEIQEHGGYVSTDDLRDYKTKVDEVTITNDHFLRNLVICGPPPPSSFAIMQTIVAVMAEFYDGKKEIDLDDPLIYHRLIEAEKFAYAQRTKFGDASFVPDALILAKNMSRRSYAKWIKSMIKDKAQPLSYYGGTMESQPEDHGTSHVSVIDRNNNAVSCTSTINQILGAMRISPTLGIVWNDEMDDFSSPGISNAFGYAPSPANFIEPGKRPMSSMSPAIVYNKNTGKVKLVVGASGGSLIVSATAQATIRALVFNQTVKESVDAPRFHNQFLPPVTFYEKAMPQEIVETVLKEKGQKMSSAVKFKSIVQALMVSDDGYIYGNSDHRRHTTTFPAGF